MEQRVTLITLGVSDLARSKAFYEALGWRGQEVEETVFFQAGGLGLVLWGRDKLAADCGLEAGKAGGFGGIVLAHNVRSDAVTKPAAVNEIGFYSSAFIDPDGHAWEVACNPGFPLAEDGSVTIPDFGQAQ
jgi:catechol 2,3-dioxygenase-like lactoylglutathione lyase family enzyme